MPVQAAGFWSYVHADDDAEDGRIAHLASLIVHQFGLLTGGELEMFVDRDLAWGDEWKRRIDEAIAGTTFFIPIVTPRYFASEECRRELVRFTSTAASLGLEQLLLPVHYVDVPVLAEESPDDDAVRRIKAVQWIDWRSRRLLADGSAEFRAGLNEMATRLAQIAEEVSSVPDTVGVAPVRGEHTDAGDQADDEPGIIEHIAEGERAMPRLNETLQDLGKEIEHVGEVVTARDPQLQKAGQHGAGPTLLVLGAIAKDLKDPASRIETLGREYTTELSKIDPAVLALIQLVETGHADHGDASELFSSIRNMTAAAAEAVDMLREMLATMDEVAALSRDLRGPLRQMQEGLRNIVDGQAVLQEWDRRVASLGDRGGGGVDGSLA